MLYLWLALHGLEVRHTCSELGMLSGGTASTDACGHWAEPGLSSANDGNDLHVFHFYCGELSAGGRTGKEVINSIL